MITTGNDPPVLKPEHQTNTEKGKKNIQMQKNEENETIDQEGPLGQAPAGQDNPQERKDSNTERKFWFTRKRPAASGRSRGNRTR